MSQDQIVEYITDHGPSTATEIFNHADDIDNARSTISSNLRDLAQKWNVLERENVKRKGRTQEEMLYFLPEQEEEVIQKYGKRKGKGQPQGASGKRAFGR